MLKPVRHPQQFAKFYGAATGIETTAACRRWFITTLGCRVSVTAICAV
jgi:hypothetical protein